MCTVSLIYLFIHLLIQSYIFVFLENSDFLFAALPLAECCPDDVFIEALCVIFVGQPLLERVTVVLNVLHVFMICLTVDWWSRNLFQPGEQKQLIL